MSRSVLRVWGVLSCWLVGIVCGSLEVRVVVIGLVAVVVYVAIARVYSRVAWRILLFVVFGLGAFHAFDALNAVQSAQRSTIFADSFVGVVVEPPEVRRDTKRVVVCVQDDSSRACQATVLVTLSRFADIAYGDRVRVRGEVEVPEQIETFRYDRYLAVSGVTHVVRASRVEIEASEVSSGVRSRLFALRARIEQQIGATLPEPEASFLAGLLLGVRSGMPPAVLDAFAKTGMTHVVALSGSNITLVATILFGLLSGLLHRRLAFGVTLIGIALFVVGTGASSSVVRAGVMGGLVLFAREVGRPVLGRSVVTVLLVSAVAMTLWRPLALVWDAGFQLSFAATVGVLFVAPRIERFFAWLPTVFSLRESVVLSVATQLTTLPISWWHFGRIAWVSPVANLFVLPVLPWAMLFGAVGVIGSGVVPGIALYARAVSVGLLRWSLWIVAHLAEVV